jgi:predicted nuclease of predicted toxin-antitoxin system
MPVVVADESVDKPIVEAVRGAGWEVWSISEECPSASDDDVLDTAAEKRSILLTMDSDFGELVFERKKEPPATVIFVRNKNLTLNRAIKLVLTTLAENELDGRYITLTRSSNRGRPLPAWKQP